MINVIFYYIFFSLITINQYRLIEVRYFLFINKQKSSLSINQTLYNFKEKLMQTPPPLPNINLFQLPLTGPLIWSFWVIIHQVKKKRIKEDD